MMKIIEEITGGVEETESESACPPASCSTNRDRPLTIQREGDELVIRMGIDRVDGWEGHPTFPPMKFRDQDEWIEDVIREFNRDDETGATKFCYLLDRMMKEAIEQGSAGLAEDSPLGWDDN